MAQVHGQPVFGLRKQVRLSVLHLGIAASIAAAVGYQSVPASATRLEHAPATSAGSGSLLHTALPSSIEGTGGSCEGAPNPTALPLLRLAGGRVAAAKDKKGTPSPPSPPANPANTVGVMCALPYTNGENGADCNGKHKIVFSTFGTGPNAKVVAELLALDKDGNLLQSAVVQNGDEAQLASRQNFQMSVKKNDIKVFAPIPLLRVTVEDHGQKAQAFCSNIPYLQLQEPKGQVVADSDGNDTKVLVAIPRTNPNTVQLKVDGVNLFTALNIPNPIGCGPLTPCAGTATINGHSVAVSNLIVDAAPTIDTLSSNTIRATVSDLACGGHNFVASALEMPGALKHPSSAQCTIDDLVDKGSSSVLAVTITSPTEGAVVPAGSTLVEGQVCSGRPIVNVKLNAMNINIVQSFQPGNGTTTGDLYTVPIHTGLGETDLLHGIQTSTAAVGTLDAGSNRLAASATDDKGNHAYAKVIFATGNVVPIGVDQALQATFSQQTLSNTIQEQLKQAVTPQIQNVMSATTTDIQNAFVVGISAGGTQKLFDKLCSAPNPDATIKDAMGNVIPNPNFGKTPGQIFKEKIVAALPVNHVLKTGTIKPSCSCNADYSIFISSVTVGDTVSCPVTFSDGKFSVSVHLPDVSVVAKAKGHCETDALGVCIAETTVDATASGTISGTHLDFDVTEGNLLNTTTSTPVFTVGGTINASLTGGVDLSCIGADVCNVVLTVLTLGQIDFTPDIDISKTIDFSDQIGASKPDPVKLKQIKVDEEVVANFDQKLSGDVSAVKISPSGIVAGLTGHFATTKIDPDVPDTPGVLLTPAPLPVLPVPNAKDVFIGLADDSINMMFASMAAAGKLKLGCVDTQKTVADLLPNCESLNLATPGATALARGMCHGIKADNCEAFSMGTVSDTATEQGVCHGVKGDVCNSIPTQAGGAIVEIGACNLTPNLNLHGNQPLLFCTQEDIPPRMLFPGDNSLTSAVPSTLRLNDLSVALIIDRDGTPGFPTAGGTLADAQSCFKNGASTTADCNLFATCMDINLNFKMGFQSCVNPTSGLTEPGFKSTFDSIQILTGTPGMVCSGSTSVADDGSVVNKTSTDQTVTIQIGSQAGQLSPDICGAGLSLGGFVSCQSPQLLAIEADGSPALKDYLAITCNVQ